MLVCLGLYVPFTLTAYVKMLLKKPRIQEEKCYELNFVAKIGEFAWWLAVFYSAPNAAALTHFL